jgi:cytidylate kinase
MDASPRGDAGDPLVITISSQFGTGSRHIAHAVAESLGLAVLDRGITAAVAKKLGMSIEAASARDGWAATGMARLLSGLSLGVAIGDITSEFLTDGDFQQEVERVLRETASTTGGVMIGRAAAVVLADRARALHVRLTGRRSDRVAAAMARYGLDQREAEARTRQTDKAREAYIHNFYRRSYDDPTLYHLILDSPRLGQAGCVAAISAAASVLANSN